MQELASRARELFDRNAMSDKLQFVASAGKNSDLAETTN
jgi:hypothetical protein